MSHTHKPPHSFRSLTRDTGQVGALFAYDEDEGGGQETGGSTDEADGGDKAAPTGLFDCCVPAVGNGEHDGKEVKKEK